MVKGVLGVPIEGSIPLLCWAWRSVCLPLRRSAFLWDDSAFNAATGAAGDSGAATAQMLSGGSTPRESMPQTVQDIC